METTETRIEQRIADLREHPIIGRWQDWAIKAKATCDVTGHTERNVFGKCNRCDAPLDAPRDPAPRERHEVAATGCAHYTDDQGCPLHGETCAR